MKQILFLVFYEIIGIAFIGCAGELSAEAQRIVLVNKKPLDCAMLGNESGQVIDTSGAMSDSGFKQSAENDLRTKSAKLGGDTIHILGEEKSWNDSWGGYEFVILGEVYKCAKDLDESSAVDSIDSSESSESSADLAKDSKK